jgi:hypothetical protein
MKKALLASAAAAAVLGLSGAASAVVVGTVQNLGVPNDGLDPSLSYGVLTGYHAWLLSADAGAGAKITAVDFSNASGLQIKAPLHQYWSISVSKGTVTVNKKTPLDIHGSNSATGASDQTLPYDSHFVLDPQAVAATGSISPDEDSDVTSNGGHPHSSPFDSFNLNPATGTPSDGWGMGTNLNGAYGIVGSFQVQNQPIAYLVIPDSATTTPIVVNGLVQADNQATKQPVTWIIGVPEPTSMGLAAIGLGGLFIRRRK